MFRKMFFVFTVIAAVSIFAAAQTAWTPETQVKMRAIDTPRVSPDGSRVVYTISDSVMTADKSEFVTQIWMATADGKENYQVTFGDKSSNNPKWSPDGSMIAFTSNRKDNKFNLYVLRIAGGEAEPVTDVKGNFGDFKWSPDGKWIAYAMTDAKDDDEDKNDKGKNDFRWIDENTKLARLYVIPMANGAAGKPVPRKLTEVNRHVTSFDWSPDGMQIVFSHVKSPLADHWPTSDISMVNVQGGTVSEFAAATEILESSPSFSPDGKWIAATISDGRVRWAQSNRIVIYAADGSAAKMMPLSHDGQPNIVGWSADGKSIYFSEAKGTSTSLYEANVAAGAITEKHSSNAVVSSLSINSGGMFGMVIQSANRPPEAFAARIEQQAPTQISNANTELAKMTVGRTEIIKWKSKDGREIEGLLHYPNGYVAGTKVPLILIVHGGPSGVWQQSYVGGREHLRSFPLATFMSRGYAILRPNPRGSNGYGTEFRRANIKDWGGMDYEDLMSGVDHVISMGVADANRLGVNGWSYGGYMTSTIITRTKRFKAASAGAPLTNMITFNGTSDIPSFIPDYFGAEFWEDPALYAKHSAMSNIKGVTTPTLVVHGEADVRVPIEQGYQLYNALKRQGVPTRMIVLPRQPHFLNEPKMQIAAMQSNLEWFDKYLK